MTTTPKEVDLDALAARIAKEGENGDEAVVLLSKGVADGMAAFKSLGLLLAGLLPLAKAKTEEPPAEPEPGGDEEDDETSEEGGADKEPGYTDMSKAVGNAPPVVVVGTTPDGATDIDMTKYFEHHTEQVVALTKAVQAQGDQISQLLAQNAQLFSENQQLRTGQQQLGQMIVATAESIKSDTVPLVKAVQDTRMGLLNAAAPGLTPHHFPRAGTPATRRQPVQVEPPAEPKVPTDLIGGDQRLESVALMKAVSNGTIPKGLSEMFRRTRKFSENPDEHTKIRASVEALVKPAPAPAG